MEQSTAVLLCPCRVLNCVLPLLWPPAEPRIHLLSSVCVGRQLNPGSNCSCHFLTHTRLCRCVCMCVCVYVHSLRHCRGCKACYNPASVSENRKEKAGSKENTARSTHRHMHMRSWEGGWVPHTHTPTHAHKIGGGALSRGTVGATKACCSPARVSGTTKQHPLSHTHCHTHMNMRHTDTHTLSHPHEHEKHTNLLQIDVPGCRFCFRHSQTQLLH